MIRQLRLGVVMLLVLAVVSAHAQESSSEPPFTPWSGTFQVKDDVPFVWLRLEPNSSRFMATLQTGESVRTFPSNLAPNTDTFWDNTHQQWWGLVHTNQTSGWVEMRFLSQISVGSPYPSATPQTVIPIPANEWQAGAKLRVKTTVPFVWIRSACDSDAEIRHTLVRGQMVWMPDGNTYEDGAQTWRTVTLPGRSPITGCVEENSFEFAGFYP